jgi:hypothetical protein
MTANPKYRYDQLRFSTVIPNFINIGNLTTNILCSGTYASGGGNNFTGSVTLSSQSNFFDVYLINQNTNQKVSLTSNVDIDLVWQYVSTEEVQDLVTVVGFDLTATINLFNGTGGSLTITSQTYTMEVVQYQIANFAV